MDRKTLISLLLVTAAFAFFNTSAWNGMVRKVFHLPDPPPASAQAADSARSEKVDAKETAAGSSRPTLGLPAGASAIDSSLPDSVREIKADSLKKIAQRRIVVRTPSLEAVVSGRGGRIESLRLLGVKKRDGSFPEILPQSGAGALTLQVGEKDLAEMPFSVLGEVKDTVVLSGSDSLVLKMVWAEGGKGVQRTWVFRAKGPNVGMRLHPAGFDKPTLTLAWNEGLLQIDPPGPTIPFGPQHFNNLVWRDNEDVESHAKDDPFALNGNVYWMGLRGQYALAAVRFAEGFREGELKATRLKSVDGQAENSYRWTFRWTPESNRSEDLELFVSPLEAQVLKAENIGFEKVLYRGFGWFFRADIWFPLLCMFVLSVLQTIHGWVPNYGVAIIVLTLLARLVLFPLTWKQVKASKRMAEVMPLLKPKLDAIKERHKDDPRKMQEETMKAYAEHGINPLAQLTGCLPLLLQMPVFISLYQVLGRAIELRGAPFTLWIHDLSRPDVIVEAFRLPLIFPAGLTILPLFMAGSMFGLNKLTIKDPQQQFMVWMMPVMMLVFSGSMPSGLVLYWTVSNLFSIVQTLVVNSGAAPATVVVQGTPTGKAGKKAK